MQTWIISSDKPRLYTSITPTAFSVVHAAGIEAQDIYIMVQFCRVLTHKHRSWKEMRVHAVIVTHELCTYFLTGERAGLTAAGFIFIVFGAVLVTLCIVKMMQSHRKLSGYSPLPPVRVVPRGLRGYGATECKDAAKSFVVPEPLVTQSSGSCM